MAGPFYFAYCDAGDDVFLPEFIRYDEIIFSVEIDHAEGDFAGMTLLIKNPRVGLLSPGRKLWAWLSWQLPAGGDVVPLFFGQIVGVPADLHAESLTVTFIARPLDYAAQQSALAESLKILPWYDPVFIQSGTTDPDTVLEARPAVWHIDRISHEVTTSNIIDGEDGTLTIDADEHFYQDMQISFSQVPLTTINVQATVSWKQVAAGDVDLTDALVDAFKAASSPLPAPYVATMTGDGLLASWPEPGKNIGGGWTVGEATGAVAATWFQPKIVRIKYPNDSAVADPASPNANVAAVAAPGAMWAGDYPIGQLFVNFTAHYDAARDRSEIMQFAMAGDVQQVFADQTGADATDAIELNSDFVDKPVDPLGMVPIGDLSRSSYFLTDRGQQSFRYLMLLARARILNRARCCEITCKTRFEMVALNGLSCRKNVRINDDRLPGGTVLGKIVRYTLNAAAGGNFATITIACAVGNGNTVSGDPGIPDYSDEDYILPGYQHYSGAVVEVVSGEVAYEDFGDFAIDDDGIDFIGNMDARSVVNSIDVANGLAAQIEALKSGADAIPPDPSGFLRNAATVVTVDLIPVSGGAFQTIFDPVISDLKISRMIDLAAI